MQTNTKENETPNDLPGIHFYHDAPKQRLIELTLQISDTKIAMEAKLWSTLVLFTVCLPSIFSLTVKVQVS